MNDQRLWAVLVLGWFLDGDEVALCGLADLVEDDLGPDGREVYVKCCRVLAGDPKYAADLNPDLWALAGRAR